MYARFVHWLSEYHKRGNVILIVNKTDDRPVGYAMTYKVNFWDGWLYVAAYIGPEFRTRMHFLEASAFCVDYLFTRFPLRKIHMEVYEFADRLRAYMERRGWVTEGYTPKHAHYEDDYTGLWTLVLHRETWEAQKTTPSWSASS